MSKGDKRGWDDDRLITWLCGFDEGQVWICRSEGDASEVDGVFEIVGDDLVVGRLKAEKRSKFLEVLVLKQCLSRGWLVRRKGRYVVTHEARQFVRRVDGRGDGFRAQHQGRSERPIDVGLGSKRSVVVNESESSLAWLAKRRGKNGAALISREQLEAGERLAAEFYRAQMSPNVTASWSAVSSSRKERRGTAGLRSDYSLTALEARDRVRAALDAVGPELSGVLLDVCCFSHGLEDAEKNAGWPKRSGKVVLQIALTSLARHYGYISDHDGAASSLRRRISHWGADGYRPDMGD